MENLGADAQQQPPTPPPPTLPPMAVAPPEVPFEKLDRQVITYWRIHSLINSAILLGLLGFVGLGFFVSLPTLRLFLAGAFMMLIALRIFFLIWYPPKRYAGWGYRLTDQVFETRYGVITKVSQMVPLSRLQHVDLQSGFIEQRLGISSLVLFTAGTTNSVIVVPGLTKEVATALRDKLVLVEGDDGV